MPKPTPVTEEVEEPRDGREPDDHGLPRTAKIVTVSPGVIPPLHYHRRRDELSIVLDAGARVEVGDEVLYPPSQEKFFIPRGTAHRISSAGGGLVRILEMAFGEFDEEDFVRLEDTSG